MDEARPLVTSEKNAALISGIRLIESILTTLPNRKVSRAMLEIEEEVGHPLAWPAVRDRMKDALMAQC